MAKPAKMLIRQPEPARATAPPTSAGAGHHQSDIAEAGRDFGRPAVGDGQAYASRSGDRTGSLLQMGEARVVDVDSGDREVLPAAGSGADDVHQAHRAGGADDAHPIAGADFAVGGDAGVGLGRRGSRRADPAGQVVVDPAHVHGDRPSHPNPAGDDVDETAKRQAILEPLDHGRVSAEVDDVVEALPRKLGRVQGGRCRGAGRGEGGVRGRIADKRGDACWVSPRRRSAAMPSTAWPASATISIRPPGSGSRRSR